MQVLASIRLTPIGRNGFTSDNQRIAPYHSIKAPVNRFIASLKASGVNCLKTTETCTEMIGTWSEISIAIEKAVQDLFTDEQYNRVTVEIFLDCKRFSRQQIPTYSPCGEDWDITNSTDSPDQSS